MLAHRDDHASSRGPELLDPRRGTRSALNHAMSRRRALASLTLAFLSLGAAACGGSVAKEGTGAGSGSSSSSSSTSSSSTSTSSSSASTSSSGNLCHVDPAGTTFTFHVHNAGTAMRALAYGCGGTIPLVLDTPAGKLSIGPGAVNSCEFTCEEQYKGPVQNGCSDCGPGMGAIVAPGATVDITWDRRVYEGHAADPSCVMGMANVGCALAVSVAPEKMQAGVLTVCSAPGPGLGTNPGGYCSATMDYSFTADTTTAATTIDIQ
jgi:hypothetical protein